MMNLFMFTVCVSILPMIQATYIINAYVHKQIQERLRKLFQFNKFENGIYNPLSTEFIDAINKKAQTWHAGQNFHPEISKEFLPRLLGINRNVSVTHFPQKIHEISDNFIFPKNFNSMDKWKHCTSIGEIRDQGSCGSCWAVSSVEVMTDRTCIFSNGTKNFRYSSDNIVACCFSDSGCLGGMPENAFDYWMRAGIVSGGPFDSMQGCQPYEVPMCDHNPDSVENSCMNALEVDPECKHECENGYPVSYQQDLHYGADVYSVSEEKNMMYEIMTNGPIVAVFDVYEDFYSYKNGIYRNVLGMLVDEHAVKIVGFGEEDGTPYWLVANSWNADWGDKGFFKILRGFDECGIEIGGHFTGIPI